MALLHSDVLCPYCLEELRASDVKMTCPLCGTLAEQSRVEMIMGKLPKCKQPGCHKSPASDRTCKYCSSKLPSDILDYEKYLRFSILGVSGSGKTTFLTTMLHELRHSPNSPWVIAPMDADTSSLYQMNDRAIYENRATVDPTAPGMPPQPQQWKIKDRGRMTNSRIPTYSLTIFDGAGEDCTKLDPAISRYINGSKALIILVDPLSLPHVARRINPKILQWSSTTEHDSDASANMVDNLANYIRQSCGIPSGKLIDRDIAVVFTKIDAVKDSFGSATVMQPSPHMAQKAFIQADADAVNAEIRDWLDMEGETAFLNAIDTTFKKNKVRFFGISSFGQPPTGDRQLARVIPHRVLDPLLWMLSKENMIPTV